jgi:hypothetical protein
MFYYLINIPEKTRDKILDYAEQTTSQGFIFKDVNGYIFIRGVN